jgi:hypothetical protein
VTLHRKVLRYCGPVPIGPRRAHNGSKSPKAISAVFTAKARAVVQGNSVHKAWRRLSHSLCTTVHLEQYTEKQHTHTRDISRVLECSQRHTHFLCVHLRCTQAAPTDDALDNIVAHGMGYSIRAVTPGWRTPQPKNDMPALTWTGPGQEPVCPAAHTTAYTAQYITTSTVHRLTGQRTSPDVM